MSFQVRRWFTVRVAAGAVIAAACLIPVSAQRGGGGAGGGGPQQTQTVGNPRFEYVGPAPSGRVAAA